MLKKIVVVMEELQSGRVVRLIDETGLTTMVEVDAYPEEIWKDTIERAFYECAKRYPILAH